MDLLEFPGILPRTLRHVLVILVWDRVDCHAADLTYG